MGEKVIHNMSASAQADLAAQQTMASQKAMSGEAAGGDDDGADPPAEKAPGADFISYNSDGSVETDDSADDGEQDDDSADDGEQDDQHAGADDKGGDRPRKPKKSVQERINEMTRQRHEAERARDAATKRAEALQTRLERIEQKLGVQNDDPDTTKTDDAAADTDDDEQGRPDPSKFDYGEIDPKYIEALSDWKVDQRLRKRDKEEQQKAAKSRETQEQEELRGKYMDQIKKGMETYDDFEEVVVQGAANNTYPLSEDLGRLIADSEAGADIAYYLASHPDEAVSVYNMTPLGQARWFGATETRFTSTEDAPKPAPVSKAPKPVTRQPRGSSGKFETPADTDDFRAFESVARKELNNG